MEKSCRIIGEDVVLGTGWPRLKSQLCDLQSCNYQASYLILLCLVSPSATWKDYSDTKKNNFWMPLWELNDHLWCVLKCIKFNKTAGIIIIVVVIFIIISVINNKPLGWHINILPPTLCIHTLSSSPSGIRIQIVPLSFSSGPHHLRATLGLIHQFHFHYLYFLPYHQHISKLKSLTSCRKIPRITAPFSYSYHFSSSHLNF